MVHVMTQKNESWPGMGPWVTQCHWQDQCLVQMAYDSLELFRVVIIFNADKSI